MPEFTRADRALMIRVGSHLKGRAQTLGDQFNANWAQSEESRAAKSEHDRLLRDARDLEVLRKRLEAQHPLAPAGGS